MPSANPDFDPEEEPPPEPVDPDEPTEKRSQAQQLVGLARERYRLAVSKTGDPFAVALDGPNLARMLRGGQDSLRAELAAAHLDAYGKPPTASAMADALLALEGLAAGHGREPLALRVAGHGSSLVVDLGDETGAAVIIRPGAWEVVDRSPVLFRRTELTGALPVPQRGGDLADLAELVNITADTWPVVVGWLVAALMPELPHPVALLSGEQGTGKSTAEAMLAGLVDPSPAQLRSSPRDVEQWSVAASGSWVVPLDNVSSIAPWLSDAICRAVTGDGMVRRRLYSDGGLSVLSFRRVVMLSAIDPGAVRGDLADRLLLVDLERITTERRRNDAEVTAAFTAAHPRLLGALFDLTARVLEVLPKVHLVERPRMADFARVLAAVDRVTGTDALDTYMGQAGRLAVEVVDSDPVAAAVRAHLQEVKQWEGTATELLHLLTVDRPQKGWPTTPKGMGAALRRAAPALRGLGFALEDKRAPGTGERLWALSAPRDGRDDPILRMDTPTSGNRGQEQSHQTPADITREQPSQPSHRHGTPSGHDERRDGRRDECDFTDATVTRSVTPEQGSHQRKTGACDGRDGCDGHRQVPSTDEVALAMVLDAFPGAALVDLPAGDIQACRLCDSVTPVGDALGPLCRSCRVPCDMCATHGHACAEHRLVAL